MVKLSINSKSEEEKFLLITIIGITESLLKNAITICEAEGAIFTPYTVKILKDKKIDNEIVKLVELGCELENIESLLPHCLEEEILKIKDKAVELLIKVERSKYIEKWLES